VRGKRRSACFYFKVKGDSMELHRLYKGDIVLIDPNAAITLDSILLIEMRDGEILLMHQLDVRTGEILGRVVERHMQV